MKILITSKGENWDSQVDPRFGRAEYLFIYNDETDKIEVIDNTEIQHQAHGAGPKTAQKVFEIAPEIIITGNGPGGNATTILEKQGAKIYIGAGGMTLKEAYQAYKDNKLEQF